LTIRLDEGDMAERLWGVAQLAAGVRIPLLGQQPDVVADGEEALETSRACRGRPVAARASAYQREQATNAPSPRPSRSGEVPGAEQHRAEWSTLTSRRMFGALPMVRYFMVALPVRARVFGHERESSA
jgi:hypothetical protein